MKKFVLIAFVMAACGAARGEVFEMFPADAGGRVLKMAPGGENEKSTTRRRQGKPAARRAEPAVRDRVVYPFFGDVVFTGTVARVSESYGGARVVRSVVEDSHAIVLSVYTDAGERHEVTFAESGFSYFAVSRADGSMEVWEHDPAADPRECAVFSEPESGLPDLDEIREFAKEGKGGAKMSGGTAEVNIMWVFDEPAVEWADEWGGGTVAMAVAGVARLNTIIENSDIDCVVRLVDVYTPEYTAVHDPTDEDILYTALRDVSNGRTGLEGVDGRRTDAEADLVALIVGGAGSIYAGVAQQPMLYSMFNFRYGFSVSVARYVNNADTFTHEVGHNFGCGHSKTQKDSPGPGFGDVAAGWYFTGTNGVRYCTVMSYTSRGDGFNYQRIPYFSTPLIEYQGVAIGDEDDGDNARCFRVTMPRVAAYKYRYPAGITASKGEFADKIRVAWNTAPQAVSYGVYRHDVSFYDESEFLGTTADPVFDDTGTVPGKNYYYWVKSVFANGAESDYSFSATGYRAIAKPAVTNVAHVVKPGYWLRVEWEEVEGAVSYSVIRNSIDDTATAIFVDAFKALWCEDNGNMVPGQIFYYWVQANGESMSSGFGQPMTGYVPLEIPNVSATSFSEDWVRCTWNNVYASGFDVWRNLSNETSTAVLVGSTSMSTYSFNDESAVPGVTYWYWVKSVGPSMDSGFGTPAQGLRMLVRPATLKASTNLADRVVLEWAAVADAATYNVYRASVKIATVAGGSTTYEDTAAAPGASYSYSVRAAGPGGVNESFSSPTATGICTLATPTVLAATFGTQESIITVTWAAVPGATGYRLWRNTTNDLNTAIERLTMSGALSFNDNSVVLNGPVKGVVYWYWLQARTSATDSAVSAPVRGGCSTLATKPPVPVPVPYKWLDEQYPDNDGNYEKLAEEEGDNGYLVWESYVAGLKPTDKNSKLFAYIRFDSGGVVAIDWEPDHRTNRVYTLLGKPALDTSGWTEFPTNAIPSNMRFFKVKVKLQ